MYLIIRDDNLIRSTERYYYVTSGKYYKECLKANPKLSSINIDNIEEMLVFSGKKVYNDKLVQYVRCSNIELKEDSIRIEYGERTGSDITCESIRKRVYGYCMKNNIINNSDFPPSILLIDNMSDYTYIKIGKAVSKFRSVMSQCDELKQKNDWLGIVRLFPEKNEIHNSEYWDDVVCLNELSFALSKLDSRYSTKKNDQKTDKYGKYFIKVSDRIIQLEPKNISAMSNRGYYYYNRYQNSKIDAMYTSALPIYGDLIAMSAEAYKEKYRFAQLKKMHFEANAWNGTYTGKDWYDAVKSIRDSFSELITSYSDLDEGRQKRYKTYYLRSLFAYATFCIDNTLQYWDSYANNKIFGAEIKSYMLEKAKFDEILNAEKHLQKICDEKHYDEELIFDLKDHPTYFEVKYRQAQIEQIKGIVYVLKNQSSEKYDSFFRKSNEIIIKLLDYAKLRREDKFLFPHYAKEPKAINHFFLGEMDQIDGCCYKARTYMKYEQARIYCILGDYEKASNIIEEIPENDTCYNKAQKLLDRIKNEA